MDYKKLLEEIKDYLSDCECMRYGEMVGAPWPYNHDGPMVYTDPDAILLEQSATAITDLMARAEAAEARAEKAEKCIAGIEEAQKFGRYSAAMLRIAEYRGKKEDH